MSTPGALPSDRGPVAWLAARVKVDNPGEPRPWVVWLVRRVLGPVIRRVWPARLEGWEHLTPDRPALVVANHSGGGVVDVLCLALLALEREGGPPRLTGMAHPLAFYVPLLRGFLLGVGAVPATYAHAHAAFERGVSVLVYPGGDHEAFRPVWQARCVDWNGRKGFLRLARRAWVPVVPLGYWGTHFTQPVLWRSKLLPWLGVLPRVFGLKRLPLTVPGLAMLLAVVAVSTPDRPLHALVLFALWLYLGPLTFILPWVPWPVRMTLGPAIPPEALFGSPADGGEDLAPLDAAYAQVLEKVQANVDTSRSMPVR